MPTQNPTLAEIFDAAMQHRMREMFGGWLPGRIETYNSTTNRATAQILLYDDYEDEEGVRRTEPFPVVVDVPVGFVSLGGRFVLRSTVNPGDEGILMFPARPTAKWLKTGGMVDPEDGSHHDIDGAVFLPYRLSAGGSNGDPMIEITSTHVDIGGTNNLVTRDEFLKHGHATAGTGSPSVPIDLSPLSGSAVTFPGTQKLRGG